MTDDEKIIKILKLVGQKLSNYDCNYDYDYECYSILLPTPEEFAVYRSDRIYIYPSLNKLRMGNGMQISNFDPKELLSKLLLIYKISLRKAMEQNLCAKNLNRHKRMAECLVSSLFKNDPENI